MVRIKVQGNTYTAEAGGSLLDTLLELGYEVPHLCHHEAVEPYGACRLCLVEVKKGRKQRLTTACNYPVMEGIEVFLDTDKVVRNRQMVLRLLLAQAPAAEAVKRLAREYGVTDTPFPVTDPDNECINCGLCARVCREVVGVEAIS
ncbi:MAG: ferredoxin, partial [Deltaproteobacteria bacterium]